jgi:hypothetical protein
MNDWLEILLTILKFAGVVVSGFAGLIAIASEKAKKKSPPKTKTGLILEHVFNKRWAIHWAIIGLVVAFLSQFSETLKVTLDEQKARRKEQQVSQIMQTQISLATSSLQKLEEQGATMHQEMLYLEYMAGKFQKLSVDVVYKVPTSDSDFAPLVQKIREIITPEKISLYEGMTNVPPPAEAGSGFSFSQNVVGYMNISNKSTGWQYLLTSSGETISIPFALVVFDQNWLEEVSSIDQMMTFFNYACSPHLKLELFSRRVNNIMTQKPDFVALTSTNQSLPIFNYDGIKKRITLTDMPQALEYCFDYNCITKEITVTRHFELPPESWKQTIRMSSIFDLDDATLRLSFGDTNNPSSLRYEPHVAYAVLDFGLVRITVDDLLPLKPQTRKANKTANYFNAYTAKMPPPNSLKVEDYEFSPLGLSSNAYQNVESGPTVGVKTPSAAVGSLIFLAPSGTLTAPFVTTKGHISQAVSTDVTNGGQAIYSFTITNAGNYVIQALVNASNVSGNSFYVNFDAQPQDPSMIWDINPVTSGFEQRLVRWRGNGTAEADQFDPIIFNLTAGMHQLIIVGREPGAQLQSLSILQLPPGPRNLHIIP